MPSIDESIRKIDKVICRHLDEIENNSRGAISQDILEQLGNFPDYPKLIEKYNDTGLTKNEFHLYGG